MKIQIGLFKKTNDNWLSPPGFLSFVFIGSSRAQRPRQWGYRCLRYV